MKPKSDSKQLVPPRSVELDPNAKLSGLRILVVEDMGLVAQILQLMLADFGCKVVAVASRLSEAMKLVQSTERLDGVLLDLNLSGESAYPVIEILRERRIPFIIMSGYDTDHIRPDCAGDVYVQKPFSRDDLASKMLHTFRTRHDV